jgi:hypothetical protein
MKLFTRPKNGLVMIKCSPIVVYTYDRFDHLNQTINALKDNHLAKFSDLFVVSDAAKDPGKIKQVSKIRDYIDEITGFKSVNKIFRDVNFGAFDSMVKAEVMVISDYGRVISMEDDIVTSKNFLDFINQGLDYYEADDKAFSIAGYCHPIKIPESFLYDSWLSPWHCPWGYGTWKKKYSKIDKNLNLISYILNNKSYRKYLNENGDFFIDTLYSDNQKIIQALDARIASQMMVHNMYTVMPSVSKVQNIGCDGSGLHCERTDRFDVALDPGHQRVFKYNDQNFSINEPIVKNYLEFMNGKFFQKLRRRFLRKLRLTWPYNLLKTIYKKSMLRSCKF